MQNRIKAKMHWTLNWNTAIFMVIFHLGAVAALFFFSWKWIVVSIALNWVGGSLGIGIGFHRLMTHRGFQTPKPLEYFLTVCGLLALEGGAINWSSLIASIMRLRRSLAIRIRLVMVVGGLTWGGF